MFVMLLRMKTIIRFFFILFCVSISGPTARAVVPPPDGGYPNFTTAEGTNALFNLTTGSANTGLGWYSLFSNSTGSFNTGVGGGALALNNADSNTAVGAAALLLNTDGTNNTAVGTSALVNNGTGDSNTAHGSFALSSNVQGNRNTAIGFRALETNTGSSNIALGADALRSNTTGINNTAVGNTYLQAMRAMAIQLSDLLRSLPRARATTTRPLGISPSLSARKAASIPRSEVVRWSTRRVPVTRRSDIQLAPI
jgi:hypothetical protein